MSIISALREPPWRTILLLVAVLSVAAGAYALWSPGAVIEDGRHDHGANGIWIQHGWLGDDAWFARYERDSTQFRDPAAILLARQLQDLAPRQRRGAGLPVLPPVDRRKRDAKFLCQSGLREAQAGSKAFNLGWVVIPRQLSQGSMSCCFSGIHDVFISYDRLAVKEARDPLQGPIKLSRKCLIPRHGMGNCFPSP